MPWIESFQESLHAVNYEVLGLICMCLFRQTSWLQFWYTDETADRVAKEMVRVANGGSIACMACPSLFRKLREKHPEQQSHLFEFDTRFEVKPFA